ncbi:MAG: PepSY domain-containing protein, partial [Butyricicoccus sp.]|nr:PepSY domain-containing protein [Butyricicoccus sp.]
SLVNRVLAQSSAFQFDELSALSVEELKDMVETGAAEMPIGRDAALEKALAYAGVAAADVRRSEVDAELDDHPVHYDVELHTASGEFEYEIAAYTGEVLRGKADILKNDSSAKSDPVVIPSAPAAQPEQSKPSVPAEQPAAKPSASAPAAKPSASDDIGSDKAKAAALAHAGLTESQIRELEVSRDRDDGRLEYEIEFKANGMEYEYTIDAATGSILEHEKDRDD